MKSNKQLPTYFLIKNKVQVNSPKHVGDFHTEVFAKTGQKYSRRDKMNQTLTTYEEDFMEVLLSYCNDERDARRCKSRIRTTKEYARNIMANTQDPMSRRVRVAYPTAMEKELKEALDDVFLALDDIEENNMNEVLERMKLIERKIQDKKSVDYTNKNVALAAVAVGKESLKLWHGVVYDSKHDLRRVLQSSPLISLPFVIGADILGVLSLPISAVGYLTTPFLFILTFPLFAGGYYYNLWFPGSFEPWKDWFDLLTLPLLFSQIASASFRQNVTTKGSDTNF